MKLRVGALLALTAVLATVAWGCASAEDYQASAPQQSRAEAVAAQAVPAGDQPSIQPSPVPLLAMEAQDSAVRAQLASYAQNRIIVHTARLSLVVSDVAVSIDRAADVASELGGWVVSSDRSSRHSGSIAIRVPAHLLEEAFSRLEGMALDTESRAVTSQDVTDEYVDNEARLVSMRATEARLLSFLERAEDVEDALLVQKEIASLQERIEETQGRLNFLRQTAAFSLIEVFLRLTPAALQVDAGPDSAVRVGDAKRFRAMFNAPRDIDEFSFAWDFGDGTTLRGDGSAPVSGGGRVTATVSHTYPDDLDSPYIVTVTLTGSGEGGLAEGSDSLLVSVSRVPEIEVFAGDNRTVEEGDKQVYSASFTRPDELQDYEYAWDFGDGSPTLQGVVEEGATRIEAKHTFADYRPSAYRVTLRVSATSDAGRVSGSDEVSVRVTEARGSLLAGGTWAAPPRRPCAPFRLLGGWRWWSSSGLRYSAPVVLVGAGGIYLARRYADRVGARRPRRPEPPPPQPWPEPDTATDPGAAPGAAEGPTGGDRAAS